MAFIRTLRCPARGRQPSFVPGSLACAAFRPLALSSAIRWAEPAPVAARAEGDQSSSGGASATSLTEDRA